MAAKKLLRVGYVTRRNIFFSSLVYFIMFSLPAFAQVDSGSKAYNWGRIGAMVFIVVFIIAVVRKIIKK